MVGDIRAVVVGIGDCYSPSVLEMAFGQCNMFVPYSFLLMFFNLFRLKEANKKFIHTAHGVE